MTSGRVIVLSGACVVGVGLVTYAYAVAQLPGPQKDVGGSRDAAKDARPRLRRLIGMTVERTPRSSRARRWFSSLSKAASPSTRSQPTASDACCRTGRNCGESLPGPTVAVAPVKKWLAVWQATVSFTHD